MHNMTVCGCCVSYITSRLTAVSQAQKLVIAVEQLHFQNKVVAALVLLMSGEVTLLSR